MAYWVKGDVGERYVPDIRFEGTDTLLRLYDLLFSDVRKVTTIPEGDVPPQAFLLSKNSKLPDFIPINGYLSVSRAVADLIEAREPGVHQLIPVRIVPRKPRALSYLDGRPIQDPYYLLNIRTKVDAACMERSVVEEHNLFPDGMVGMPSLGKAVLKKSVIAGLSLWMGKHQFFKSTFCSDEFAAVLPNKAKGLKLTYCEEV